MTENTPKLRWNKERVVALCGGTRRQGRPGSGHAQPFGRRNGRQTAVLCSTTSPSLAGLLRELALAGTRGAGRTARSVRGIVGGTDGRISRVGPRASGALRGPTLRHPAKHKPLPTPDLSEAEERIIGVCLRVAKGFGLEGPAGPFTRSGRGGLSPHGFFGPRKAGRFRPALWISTKSYRLAVQKSWRFKPGHGHRQPLLANGLRALVSSAIQPRLRQGCRCRCPDEAPGVGAGTRDHAAPGGVGEAVPLGNQPDNVPILGGGLLFPAV